MSHADSLAYAEPSVPAKRLISHSDFSACEDAMRELGNGPAVLYALAHSETEGAGVDAAQMGQALYFLANNLSRELGVLSKALGLEDEGGDND
jgi:hypothetical protein